MNKFLNFLFDKYVKSRAKKYSGNFASGFLTNEFSKMSLGEKSFFKKRIINIISDSADEKDFEGRVKLKYMPGSCACISSEKYHLAVLEKKSQEGAYVIFLENTPVGHVKKEGISTFVSWYTQEKNKTFFPIIGGLYDISSPGIYSLIKYDLPVIPFGFGKITLDDLCLSSIRFMQAENVLETEFPAEYSRRLIRELRTQVENNELAFQYSFELKLNSLKNKYILEKLPC